MPTIIESLEELDRMVTNHAATHEIRSQIAFVQREVIVLQADALRANEAMAALNDANARLKSEQADQPPQLPSFGSQPRIKGRMER